MIDGGLRISFQNHLPEFHWQGIETGGTGLGIPDVNGCFQGIEFWIEMKLTSGWSVDIAPHQSAWAERRVRAGGRIFLAVRRQVSAGPRRGAAVDELWLFKGEQARQVALSGLKGSRPIGYWAGGPAQWDWIKIKELLTASGGSRQ